MQKNKAFALVNWLTKKTNTKNSNLKKARIIRFRVFLLNAMAIAKNNLWIIKSVIRRTGSLLQSKSIQIWKNKKAKKSNIGSKVDICFNPCKNDWYSSHYCWLDTRHQCCSQSWSYSTSLQLRFGLEDS